MERYVTDIYIIQVGNGFDNIYDCIEAHSDYDDAKDAVKILKDNDKEDNIYIIKMCDFVEG